MNSKHEDFQSLLKFLVVYQSRKTQAAALHIEKVKNNSVDVLMHKRGKLQKYVWHTSMVGLASVGFLSSSTFGGNTIVASTFPGVISQDPQNTQTYDPQAGGSDGNLGSLIDFKTSVSDKPRSEIINYEVKSGETLSQIAQKFSIDVETIKWANDLSSDSVKPGQTLKILPVAGVAHTVKSGDTLQTVAKKYQADAQAILDYPFNDIPDDFKLTVGQVIIVPDGTPPEVATPKPKAVPQYLAQGSGNAGPSYSAPNGGSFILPAPFVQFGNTFSWWHPGTDFANPSSPPVKASDGGTVVVAGWPDNYGYGNRVVIDHGNGYQTLYAHLANIYVSPGQKVGKGQVIGQMGNTGRSTGTHLHFEIHFKGVALNPMAILR
jgi:murein DD-endopeptidase MepM/ murein hydrolase activator NlpD